MSLRFSQKFNMNRDFISKLHDPDDGTYMIMMKCHLFVGTHISEFKWMIICISFRYKINRHVSFQISV